MTGSGFASTAAPTPVAPVLSATPARTTVCELGPGKWVGPLRVAGVTVAQSGHAQELVLTTNSLHTHLSGEGWHVYGEADLRQDSILRASRTVWVGEGVAVPAGGRTMVLAAENGSVQIGVAPTPGVAFAAVPSRWVPCGAVGLGVEEPDEDTALDSLRLPRGRAGHVSTLTLSHLPGGEPFVRQEEGEAEVHSVRIIEERHGFTRVAGYLHGGGSLALLVGWAQPLAGGVVSGSMMGTAGRDGSGERRCRIPNDLPLFAAGEGLPRQEVGRVERGTTLWASPGEDGQWSVHPLPGDDALHFADGIELSVQPSVPLVCAPAGGAQ
ncbi:MAG: hypothetical protein ACI9KE_003448 [Polyangiales bacterium]|jgi:hypothetical protein